jgi:hypothetical protein
MNKKVKIIVGSLLIGIVLIGIRDAVMAATIGWEHTLVDLCL